jgi:hypothetical protein
MLRLHVKHKGRKQGRVDSERVGNARVGNHAQDCRNETRPGEREGVDGKGVERDGNVFG